MFNIVVFGKHKHFVITVTEMFLLTVTEKNQ